MPRKLQEQTPRVETGPVQFAGDWTGLFIRGDDCCRYASDLDTLLSLLSLLDQPTLQRLPGLALHVGRVERLRDLMRQTDESATA